MEAKRQKTVIRAALVLAILAGGGWFAKSRLGGEARAAGKNGPAAEARPVPVVLVDVAQRDAPVYLDGLGNVVASATVTVRAQVDGRLERVVFREGQEVKKGDVLAQIDPRPFHNQLHLAEASQARDRAQLGGARVNLERYEAMRKEGLTSQQQVDDQRALVAQLDATTRADQAQIDSARLNLDYARVTAPIDGVLGVRLVDSGNVVRAADGGGLVVITAIDPIAVIFTLPQDDLPRVQAALAAGKITVEAMSRDGGQRLAAGELSLIDNQINQATATMRLKAVFANAERRLWPNQLVKTRLLLRTRKAALVVPAAVVQRGPQGTFAYVVGADQKAAVRPVEVEGTDGDHAVIASGLSAGEHVVVDGQYQLKPGSRVAPRDGTPTGREGASRTPTVREGTSGSPTAPRGAPPGKEGSRPAGSAK